MSILTSFAFLVSRSKNEMLCNPNSKLIPSRVPLHATWPLQATPPCCPLKISLQPLFPPWTSSPPPHNLCPPFLCFWLSWATYSMWQMECGGTGDTVVKRFSSPSTSTYCSTRHSIRDTRNLWQKYDTVDEMVCTVEPCAFYSVRLYQ
jgi:hypothetical protein